MALRARLQSWWMSPPALCLKHQDRADSAGDNMNRYGEFRKLSFHILRCLTNSVCKTALTIKEKLNESRVSRNSQVKYTSIFN